MFAGGKIVRTRYEGKPMCVCIGAHTHSTSASLCACFKPNNAPNFPLQFLLQPKALVCACQISPFFAEIVLDFPSIFRFIFVLTFELCFVVCVDFKFFIQISSPFARCTTAPCHVAFRTSFASTWPPCWPRGTTCVTSMISKVLGFC